MPRVRFVTADGLAQEFQSTVSANRIAGPSARRFRCSIRPSVKDAPDRDRLAVLGGARRVLTFAGLLFFAWKTSA